MRMVRNIVLGTMVWVGIVSMIPGGAAAESQRKQCQAEAKQLCPGVEPGPALRECVTKNVERLSPACQERFRAWQAKHPEKTTAPAGGTAQ